MHLLKRSPPLRLPPPGYHIAIIQSLRSITQAPRIPAPSMPLMQEKETPVTLHAPRFPLPTPFITLFAWPRTLLYCFKTLALEVLLRRRRLGRLGGASFDGPMKCPCPCFPEPFNFFAIFLSYLMRGSTGRLGDCAFEDPIWGSE